MAAAVTTTGTLGRGNVIVNPSLILVSIAASSTAYATASGGLPIDLTVALQTAAPSGFDAPNYIQALNPADIIGVSFNGLSANGYMPTNFVLGTPTYTAVPWASSTNASAQPGILATCPATVRLWGTGASNHSSLGEISDGNITDTITFWLVVARSGANN